MIYVINLFWGIVSSKWTDTYTGICVRVCVLCVRVCKYPQDVRPDPSVLPKFRCSRTTYTWHRTYSNNTQKTDTLDGDEEELIQIKRNYS